MGASRRRSLKRRDMRGGLQKQFAKNTDGFIGTFPRLDAYIQMRRTNGFPIFSQKRGICATDAFTNVFWWADGIREHFWRAEVYSKNGTYDTRLQTAAGTVVEAEKGGNVTMPEAAQLIVKLSLHRLVSLFERKVLKVVQTPGTPSMTLRAASEQIPGVGAPTGEVCALYTVKYADGNTVRINPGDVASISSFGTTIDRVEPLLKSAFDKYCPGLASVGTTLDAGYTPVAILVRTLTPSGEGHRTLCVRIGGVWHHMDNNNGVSIPLLKSGGQPLTLDEMNAGTFQISYGHDPVAKKNFTKVTLIANGTETFSTGNVFLEIQGDTGKFVNETWKEDPPGRRLVGYKFATPPVYLLPQPSGVYPFTDEDYKLYYDLIIGKSPMARAFGVSIMIIDGLTPNEFNVYNQLKSGVDAMKKTAPDATNQIIAIGDKFLTYSNSKDTLTSIEKLPLFSKFRTMLILCSSWNDIAQPYIGAILKTKDFKRARNIFSAINDMYTIVRSISVKSKETTDDMSGLSAVMYPALVNAYDKFKLLEAQIAEAEKAPPQTVAAQPPPPPAKVPSLTVPFPTFQQTATPPLAPPPQTVAAQPPPPPAKVPSLTVPFPTFQQTAKPPLAPPPQTKPPPQVPAGFTFPSQQQEQIPAAFRIVSPSALEEGFLYVKRLMPDGTSQLDDRRVYATMNGEIFEGEGRDRRPIGVFQWTGTNLLPASPMKDQAVLQNKRTGRLFLGLFDHSRSQYSLTSVSSPGFFGPTFEDLINKARQQATSVGKGRSRFTRKVRRSSSKRTHRRARVERRLR
jgi:hypothetical protein